MENKTSFIEPLLEKAEEYGKTSLQILKYRSLDKLANFASTFIVRAFIFLTIFMLVFITSIGLALWIGDFYGKLYYGFFCVAGFYVLLGLVLYFLMYNSLKRSIGNSIISEILN